MTEKIKFKNLEKTINELFHKKYKIDYNNYIIENIIFNEKSHLVSIFKDNLITNDDYEFFKEFYPIKDSIKRLIKYIEYYQKYNYLFPNYSALPESEYLFRNINRKQRIIDEQQNNKKKQNINNENQNSNNKDKNNLNNNNNAEIDNNKSNKIFNSNVYDSILKNTNNSYCSQFGIKINNNNNEKIDSIGDIQNIITEINNNPPDINNFFKLDDSPARPMLNNNNIYTEINRNNNDNRNKKFDEKINNTNFCYNKFKNRNIKNLLFNTNNNNIIINNNTNTPQTKNTFFSPLYKKINIKINPLSNIRGFDTNKNINKKNINFNSNNNILINDNTNNTTKNKQSLIYRKLSPMNKLDRLSFSIKRSVNNKESLRTINYFTTTTKSSISGIPTNKKYSSKFELLSCERNKINFPNKNIIKNNINNHNHNNQNLYINNTQILSNKLLYAKRRANSDMNCNFKINNCINYMPRENTVYIFNNNNSNIQNYKMNQVIKNIKKQHNSNTLQNRTKSLSIKKNSINNVIKPYITDNLIDSISNKIKRESQNYISKRIYNLINKCNKKQISGSSKKNTISLRKYFALNKKENNNKNSINNKILINKDILTLEKNSLYNKDTLGNYTINSTINNNTIHINRAPMYNVTNKYLNNNTYITPNIKKHISFKQYLNNNFYTINNAYKTYNCKLLSTQNTINTANNGLYSVKNSNNSKNNKYIYDTNTMNNKKLKTITGFRNKKLVINTDNKKKILIVKKKESKISTNKNKPINKNIIIINNNKKKKHKNNKTGTLNNNNNLQIKEYEKIQIIEPQQALYSTDYFKNKKIIKK